MIKKLLGQKIDSITMAAFLVGFFSLLSRLLGVLRDRILAGQFGAGDELDIYYAAFRMPDLIFNLIVLGALSAGFIPVFSQMIKRDESRLEAWRLVNNVLNILSVFIIILIVILFSCATPLIKLITPGFSPDKISQTVFLTRIMFLSPLLLGLSSVIGGVLQSYKRFFVYSLSPIFYNLGIILGAILLTPYFGLVGLAWGVALGSMMHLVVQIPVIIKLGWSWQPIFDWRDKQFITITKMMTARTMSLVITQVNLLIVTIFASTLASGSLAVFNLANNLQSFPVGIFGISFAIAVFPAISSSAFDKPRLIKYFSKTFRQILFFIIPSMIIMLFLRAQIIRLILGSGKFDWTDTVATMNVLTLFSLSLFAQATIPLLVRFFYARHDSKTPFYLGLISSVVEIILAWTFIKHLNTAGLALSFSCASILQFCLLLTFLRKEIGQLDGRVIYRSLTKMLTAAAYALAIIQISKTVLGHWLGLDYAWEVMLQTAIPALLGLMAYVAVAYLNKSQEMLDLLNSVKRHVPWRQVSASDQGEARGI